MGSFEKDVKTICGVKDYHVANIVTFEKEFQVKYYVPFNMFLRKFNYHKICLSELIIEAYFISQQAYDQHIVAETC